MARKMKKQERQELIAHLTKRVQEKKMIALKEKTHELLLEQCRPFSFLREKRVKVLREEVEKIKLELNVASWGIPSEVQSQSRMLRPGRK